MGCFHGASFTGEVADANGPVYIDFCFNGACVHGDGYATTNNCTTFGIQPASVSYCFENQAASGTWRVSGYVTLSTANTKDGDRFAMTVTDVPSSIVLGSADENVHYDDYSPNGVECGPTCKRAEFHIAPP